MKQSLAHVLENFSSHGNDTAYIQHRGYRTERWSYGKVSEIARQFAFELRSRNIQPNENIVIWGESCAEWVAAFLGAVIYGAVVVPLDRMASADFIRKVCDQVDPRLIIHSRNAPTVKFDAATLYMDNLAQIVSRHSKDTALFGRILGSQPAEIVFTSGTTSEPKGVVITHENIIANLQPLEAEIRKYLKYERFVHPLRFMNLLPLSHMFGQYLGLFIPQIFGATVVFQNSMQEIGEGRENTFFKTLVDFSACASQVRMEILGFYLRRRTTERNDGTFLEHPRLRCYSGIRSYGNNLPDKRESPL
ncbi:MAG: AMP-binding protein [Acidobacteriota bacterium]